MKMPVLIAVVTTQMDIFPKTHRTVHLRSVHFSVYKLLLNLKGY